MQKVTLQALPTDEPWTVEEFLERTEDTCRNAAVVSHILWTMTPTHYIGTALYAIVVENGTECKCLPVM
jgi:hypothetical protein